ncbi:MAG: hypothetical protein IT373_07525 [Polyangiaceae bacterium]|nr:hypothetical protein [Polyangiaceae bacterium]
MHRSAPALILFASALASGCASGAALGPGVGPDPPAARSGPSAPVADEATHGSERALAIRLVGAPEPEPFVRVEVRARGPAPELARFTVAEAAGARDFQARDAAGALPVSTTPDGTAIVLGRAASGEVELSYRVPGSFENEPLAVRVEPGRLKLTGERVLWLPEAFDARGVDVELALGTEPASPPALVGASSFGLGTSQRFRALGSELRHAAFVLGAGGQAELVAPEGRDAAAWIGMTSFDPRPVVADVAAFRSAVGALLGEPDPTPTTYLLATEPLRRGEVQVIPRTAGALVAVGLGQPWTGELRIALATVVVQHWVGGRLWLGSPSPDPASEAEAAWFTGGVARALARDLLFSFGLLTADEYLREIGRLLDVAHASPLRALGSAELARAFAADRAGPALRLAIARGALYASDVHARLRTADPKSQGLPALVRELLGRARAAGGPLPVASWLELVGARTGSDEAPAFARFVAEPRAPVLGPGTFGPCFRAAPGRYPLFALGLDAAASRAAHQVVGLDPTGPAARAGVRESEPLELLRFEAGRTDVEVELLLGRGAAPVTVRFVPLGGHVLGQVWSRVPGVPDERCTE